MLMRELYQCIIGLSVINKFRLLLISVLAVILISILLLPIYFPSLNSFLLRNRYNRYYFAFKVSQFLLLFLQGSKKKK